VWATTWSIQARGHGHYRCGWLTAVLLLLHNCQHAISKLCPSAATYGHRPTHLQRLPHEELRALAHGHDARGLHSQHASRLHRQGPGSFEHVCGVGCGCNWSGELASKSGSWVGDEGWCCFRGFRHRHADAERACGTLESRKTPSELCVDNALRVERSNRRATSPLHFRHHHQAPTPPCHCRNTTTVPTPQTIATMSDNENGENGDELVTKPFKFVTGELFPLLRKPLECIANTSPCSWYATSKTPLPPQAPPAHLSGAPRHAMEVLTSFGAHRLRCPLPQPEPDQALLAKLRRLPQVHHCQGRGLCPLPPGAQPAARSPRVEVY